MGAKMVVKDNASDPWKVIDGIEDEVNVDVTNPVISAAESSTTGTKRNIDSSPGREPYTKKQRTGGSSETRRNNDDTCLAPLPVAKSQEILATVSNTPPNYENGAGDIFLTEDWRSRWCRCSSVRLYNALSLCSVL